MKDVISVDTTGEAISLQELKEKLAAIEHERWADWQKWCNKILRANIKHDIEPTLAHWEKQIATPYSKLTREEQLSDIEQVNRYWPLLLQSIHSLLISKLPERQAFEPTNTPRDEFFKGHQVGHNKCLDEMRKSIDELFGVGDE